MLGLFFSLLLIAAPAALFLETDSGRGEAVRQLLSVRQLCNTQMVSNIENPSRGFGRLDIICPNIGDCWDMLGQMAGGVHWLPPEIKRCTSCMDALYTNSVVQKD